MIYLETLPDQSTAADLRSQCRFITQQGIQKLIVCDNETVLKGRSLKRCSIGQGKSGVIIFHKYHGVEDCLSTSFALLRGALLKVL